MGNAERERTAKRSQQGGVQDHGGCDSPAQPHCRDGFRSAFRDTPGFRFKVKQVARNTRTDGGYQREPPRSKNSQ